MVPHGRSPHPLDTSASSGHSNPEEPTGSRARAGASASRDVTHEHDLALDEGGKIVAFRNEGPPGLSEPASQVRIQEHLPQAVRELPRVMRVEQETGLAMGDEGTVALAI